MLLTGITRTQQLVFLLAIPALLAVYWRFRTRPAVVAWYAGMAIALFAWILLCEHIVLLDRALGTRISTQLQLSPRLTSYVFASLPTAASRQFEPCCNDPLMWRYRPGSLHRAIFDCPTCNPPYETVVDETGYLNHRACPPQCYAQINVFVAGDSVLQGMGVPSVVERLRTRIPLRFWNLSIQGYGPRQKVDALLTFALPHAPRWLVVEFYGGNDLAEAIRDDVCQHGGDYRCRYNRHAVERRLAQHAVYSTMFNVRTGLSARIADYTTENLTLATTQYLLDRMKGALKHPGNALANASQVRSGVPAPRGNPSPAIGQIAIAPWLALGGSTPAPVRAGQWPAYVGAGLAVTQREYERLATALAQRALPPAVILLYNPAPYEIYRLMGMELDLRAEQMYPVQREALQVFAREHGWHFLDLTEPLRRVVRHRDAWLYGEFDQSHWSPEGTAIVSEVLATELSRVLRSNY